MNEVYPPAVLNTCRQQLAEMEVTERNHLRVPNLALLSLLSIAVKGRVMFVVMASGCMVLGGVLRCKPVALVMMSVPRWCARALTPPPHHPLPPPPPRVVRHTRTTAGDVRAWCVVLPALSAARCLAAGWLPVTSPPTSRWTSSSRSFVEEDALLP